MEHSACAARPLGVCVDGRSSTSAPPPPPRAGHSVCCQLREHLEALRLPIKSCGEDTTPLRRALVAGLFPHAARRQLDGKRGCCEP